MSAVKERTDDTPLMRQYHGIKSKYPGALLLFRMGDFYETFGEDAIQAAGILGITLTKRGNGSASEIELAGFPHHALDAYLPKLVRAGLRVAVCDQLEDPRLVKGKNVVKRGVTQVVSPGLALDENLVDRSSNNYVAALHYVSPQQLGAAFLDLSTGDYFALSGDPARLEKLLSSLQPAEVLLSRQWHDTFADQFGKQWRTVRLDEWLWEVDYASGLIRDHFRVQSLKPFGLEDEVAGAIAAGALLHYCRTNEYSQLGHVTRLYLWPHDDYVTLDRFTLRNLEVIQPLHSDGRALFDVMDRTLTPMGARLLKRWLTFPLRRRERIIARQARVAALVEQTRLREEVRASLRGLGDLERLVARLATLRLLPREAWTLRESLNQLHPLFVELLREASAAFGPLLLDRPNVERVAQLLGDYLLPECPNTLGSGNVIAEGISPELDELRLLKRETQAVLERFRIQEVERTGISSLKVSFNKVFGYYIEITNAHRDRVPPEYIRKQTLTNAERYITPEIKIFEEKILTAEERIEALETALYQELLAQLQGYLAAIQHYASLAAEVDATQCLAELAAQQGYCQPQLTDDTTLEIRNGRHPVIEQLLPPDQPFVPNDLQIDTTDRQILLITGPNMAGKSALLRQTALIVLLAQSGSYVPASHARIGLVDRIFTRVGASDNLSVGESTFLVEMHETARILHNLTPRSLVLLDEIGRGTSTYDGISIAWALVEHLHQDPAAQARTLFATHYHELAELEGQLARVHNFHMAVQQVDGQIIFLRKLQPGPAAHSFGINVARMAGLPVPLLLRAQEILTYLEQTRAPQGQQSSPTAPMQLQLFQVDDRRVEQLRQMLDALDLNRMTPVEALLKLQEIKGVIKG